MFVPALGKSLLYARAVVADRRNEPVCIVVDLLLEVVKSDSSHLNLHSANESGGWETRSQEDSVVFLP